MVPFAIEILLVFSSRNYMSVGMEKPVSMKGSYAMWLLRGRGGNHKGGDSRYKESPVDRHTSISAGAKIFLCAPLSCTTHDSHGTVGFPSCARSGMHVARFTLPKWCRGKCRNAWYSILESIKGCLRKGVP